VRVKEKISLLTYFLLGGCCLATPADIAHYHQLLSLSCSLARLPRALLISLQPRDSSCCYCCCWWNRPTLVCAYSQQACEWSRPGCVTSPAGASRSPSRFAIYKTCSILTKKRPGAVSGASLARVRRRCLEPTPLLRVSSIPSPGKIVH
jgi:hypothetical protein